MSTPKRSRGRPKGTGIDDSQTLNEITEMIAADPDLKPTTAIKLLGISDPSTIRRLRDKYKSAHPETDTEIGFANSDSSRSSAARVTPTRDYAEHRASQSQPAIVLERMKDDRLVEPLPSQRSGHGTRTKRTRARSSPKKTSRARLASDDRRDRSSAATTARHSSGHADGHNACEATRETASPRTGVSAAADLPATPADIMLGIWRQQLATFRTAQNIQNVWMRETVNTPWAQMLIQQQIALTQAMIAARPNNSEFVKAMASIIAPRSYPKSD